MRLLATFVAWLCAAGPVCAQESAPSLDELFRRLYDGTKHPLTKSLQSDKWSLVEVRSRPGQLMWFNPDLAIPELGIEPGQPLTASQKSAIVRLFSVSTTPESSGKGRGAFFMSDVGRAVNPTSGVLTVRTRDGEVLPDLVSKGVGRTRDGKPGADWYGAPGKMQLGGIGIDIMVSQNLLRAGADVYVPVAMIQTELGHGISVRAARSLLRQDHPRAFTDAEFTAVVQQVVETQTGRRMSPADALRYWAGEYLPRQFGRNSAVLGGLGIKHVYLNQNNYGLQGEMVDFEDIRFVDRASEVTLESHESLAQSWVRRVNRMMAPAALESLAADELGRVAAANGVADSGKSRPAIIGELLGKFTDPWIQAIDLKGLTGQIPFDEVRARYQEAYRLARTRALRHRVRLDAGLLEQLEPGLLVDQVSELVKVPYDEDPHTLRRRAIQALRKLGIEIGELKSPATPTNVSSASIPGAAPWRERVATTLRRETDGGLTVLAAMVLKEAVLAAATLDADRAKELVAGLGSLPFWQEFLGFTAGLRTGEEVLERFGWLRRRVPGWLWKEGRRHLPLGIGAALGAVAGGRDVDGGDVLLTMAAYPTAGKVVEGAEHLAVRLTRWKPPLGGRWGRLWRVGQLAAVLILGEKIDQGVRSATSADGVVRKLDAVGSK